MNKFFAFIVKHFKSLENEDKGFFKLLRKVNNSKKNKK